MMCRPGVALACAVATSTWGTKKYCAPAFCDGDGLLGDAADVADVAVTVDRAGRGDHVADPSATPC